MCLAKVFMMENDEERLLLENVALLEQKKKELILTTLFRESMAVHAQIDRIDFAGSKVWLKSRGED